jgi:hypothetical protein
MEQGRLAYTEKYRGFLEKRPCVLRAPCRVGAIPIGRDGSYPSQVFSGDTRQKPSRGAIMDDDKFRHDLLMRKFEPVSDTRPSGQEAGITQTLRSAFNETVEQAQKQKEALESAVGPVAEEAWVKIKDLAGLLEDSTIKSSKEARLLIAKTLHALAEKIEP